MTIFGFCDIMFPWKSTVVHLSFHLCKRCDGKIDGCLVIPLGRNGGECIVLDGKFSRRELIHITLSEIGAICTILKFMYEIFKDVIAYKKRK